MEESNKNEPKEYKAGDVYEIPAEGSLGLLALGYRGLVVWREAQEKAKAEKATETKSDEEANTAEDKIA